MKLITSNKMLNSFLIFKNKSKFLGIKQISCKGGIINMIKRTVEKVLSWIGNILHLLYLGFIALMVSMMGNKDFKHEMIHNTQDSNQGVSSDQLNQSYGMLSSMGTWYIIGFIVLLILAIIATLLISKNLKLQVSSY